MPPTSLQISRENVQAPVHPRESEWARLCNDRPFLEVQLKYSGVASQDVHVSFVSLKNAFKK